MKVYNTINLCILIIALAHNWDIIRSRYIEALCVLYTLIVHMLIGMILGIKYARQQKQFTVSDFIEMVYGTENHEMRIAYTRLLALSWLLYQSLIYFIF